MHDLMCSAGTFVDTEMFLPARTYVYAPDMLHAAFESITGALLSALGDGQTEQQALETAFALQAGSVAAAAAPSGSSTSSAPAPASGLPGSIPLRAFSTLGDIGNAIKKGATDVVGAIGEGIGVVGGGVLRVFDTMQVQRAASLATKCTLFSYTGCLTGQCQVELMLLFSQ